MIDGHDMLTRFKGEPDQILAYYRSIPDVIEPLGDRSGAGCAVAARGGGEFHSHSGSWRRRMTAIDPTGLPIARLRSVLCGLDLDPTREHALDVGVLAVCERLKNVGSGIGVSSNEQGY